MAPSYPKFYNPEDDLSDYVMDELYYYHGGEALSKDMLDVIIGNSSDNTNPYIIIHFTEHGKKVSIDISNPNTRETIELSLTYAHMPAIHSYLRENLPTVQIKDCIITTGPNSGPLIEEHGGGSRHTKATSHYMKTTYKHNGYVVYKCTHNKKTPTYHIKQKDVQTGHMVWKKITLKSKN